MRARQRAAAASSDPLYDEESRVPRETQRLPRLGSQGYGYNFVITAVSKYLKSLKARYLFLFLVPMMPVSAPDIHPWE